MQIAGSSAIVVGGAGGLGEATVRRLHAAGAKVVVADLADEKGKALESELGRALRADRRHLRGIRQRRDRRGGVACPAADLRRHPRRPGQRRPADRQGRFAAGPRRLQEDHRVLPDRGVQRDAAVGGGHRQVRTPRRRRPRRHRQHRLDRRLRGPDRPAPVLGGQGWRARHDARSLRATCRRWASASSPSPPAPSTPRRTARPPTSSSSTGARRCRSPSAWVARPSTPSWRRASSRTTTSTARSSASTERCGSRRSDDPRRQGRVRRRRQPRHRRDDRERPCRAGAAVAVAARSEERGQAARHHRLGRGLASSSSGGRALPVAVRRHQRGIGRRRGRPQPSPSSAASTSWSRMQACCGSAQSNPRR